ncbi:MAG: hypothetical protein EPN25_13995 [Nitrospirae bacterium]|nr:MAG: hypothetical protein EPN25_13995 [Nitrospirota bacterium]
MENHDIINYQCGIVRRQVQKMVDFPFQDNDVSKLYNRLTKLSPASLLMKEQGEPLDIVNISSEGKMKQILAQTKSEVLDRIKDATRRRE